MATIRIKVLGPVQAWHDGVEIRLGSPQQRCVLALLTIANGNPVPSWSLVESLWGSPPPPSALNMVQVYVMRLRRLLDPGRSARSQSSTLPRVSGGYALRLPRDQVDLWRFQAMLSSAQAARRTGDHRRAVSTLNRALGLWRGPIAADLPAIADQPRARAADDHRATAAALLADAALDAGAATDVLALVAEAASARPLDESLQARLMKMLHAAGRRSDAVATYWSARGRLRDELGLDPGPELDAAYHALLGGEQFRMSPA